MDRWTSLKQAGLHLYTIWPLPMLVSGIHHLPSEKDRTALRSEYDCARDNGGSK